MSSAIPGTAAVGPALREARVTQRLAEYAAAAEFANLPADVRHQATRALLNNIGCMLGGSMHQGVRILLAAADDFAGPRTATVYGHPLRLDPLHAAAVNCMSSAVHTYDDTHLASISHPGGPVIAAVLALGEGRQVTGAQALNAIVVGIETACRLGKMLFAPPASANLNLFMTSVTGGIGAAVAVSRLLDLDANGIAAGIGIAAAQACGLREMHGTMTSSFMCGHASRCGVEAALLAARGFTSGMRSIEGPKGFASVFAEKANLEAVTLGLGETFEISSLSYKPYPCGVAAHPAIDACLDLVAQHGLTPDEIAACELIVHPVTLQLMGRNTPPDGLQAQVSAYHWCAAALQRGKAGLDEATDDCVTDPAVIGMRDRLTVTANAAIAAVEAKAALTTRDGRRLHAHVKHCRGSAGRPLTDQELITKFRNQAVSVIGNEAASRMEALCLGAENLESLRELPAACQVHTRSASDGSMSRQ